MNQTKSKTVLLSSLILVVGLPGLVYADAADPEYASGVCQRDKRPSKVCCAEVLDGDKKEIAECVQLVAAKRKKATEAKAAKVAAKKASAEEADSMPDVPKAKPVKAAGGLVGKWSFEFGDTMYIDQEKPEFRARYNFKDGRIYGEKDENTVSGIWTQNSAKSKCNEEKEGTHYWGGIKLEFFGNEYQGSWGYCDNPLEYKLKPGKKR